MNSFQILNKDNKAIKINDLDLEASIFWNVPIHPKQYANPMYHPNSNWFDVIGWNIANQGHECSGWANVVSTMMATSIGMKLIDTSEGYKDRAVLIKGFEPIKDNDNILKLPDEVELDIYGILTFYKPFIELINHWQSKGYKAKQIKE